MKKLYLYWEIYEEKNQVVQRHCHNCGEKVGFMDSGIRRHNANGKDIYEFAIYKCLKGHSWNKPLAHMKPDQPLVKRTDQTDRKVSLLDSIDTNYLATEGFDAVVIQLVEVTTRTRLDKLLSNQIANLSRNQIAKQIIYGKILVDDRVPELNTRLKKGQQIRIQL